MSNFSNIASRARAHYQGLGRKQIEVPEWGDESGPLMVYSSPMTLGEKRKLSRSGGTVDYSDPTVLAELVIMKAEDDQGRKMFTKQDKMVLVNESDSDVVSRIALEMAQTWSVEDAEKN